MLNTRSTAVVLAAGQGKRMNSAVAKQFLTLKEKPVLYYSLKAFEESLVDEIILVTGEGQVEYCKENLVEQYHFNKVTKVIEGGKERYDSVYKALACIKDSDYVLIHDGARPFITKELIEKTAKEAVKEKACILGTPVKETIKVVGQDGKILSTPDRNALWSAQTPQAFEFSSILKAYKMLYEEDVAIRNRITDDAMVYETYLKKSVKMIYGDYNNLKLTTPEDLRWAQVLADELF